MKNLSRKQQLCVNSDLFLGGLIHIVAEHDVFLLVFTTSRIVSIQSSGRLSNIIRGLSVMSHCSFQVFYFLSKIPAAYKMTVMLLSSRPDG
jgi:hypothetical protein